MGNPFSPVRNVRAPALKSWAGSGSGAYWLRGPVREAAWGWAGVFSCVPEVGVDFDLYGGLGLGGSKDVGEGGWPWAANRRWLSFEFPIAPFCGSGSLTGNDVSLRKR